ncbi:MAG: spore coat protein [Oscillospiraceae bacterium]|nr:spore coat protein [Oscillospiraceae bacterium]
MAKLTTKELTALDESLNQEQVIIKKYHTMAGQCGDTKLKSQLESIATRHQKHYNTLISHLK